MKTHVRRLRGGGVEIIRLLSPKDLEVASRDHPLFYEKSIVWLTDIASVPFVRVKTVRSARSRRGPLYLAGDIRVLGYSKLTADAPVCEKTKGYERRVFYLAADDKTDGNQPAPPSSVNPRSVQPGSEGCAPVEECAEPQLSVASDRAEGSSVVKNREPNSAAASQFFLRGWNQLSMVPSD